MGVIESQFDFRSLGLRDLLEAREQYHWHLTNLSNVVGTAVGLYLIRDGDRWPDRDNPDLPVRGGHTQPRTLANSHVRPYSWPCVLVFVSEWKPERDFGESMSPKALIPRTLYLPDGRAVPACVVQVEPGEPVLDRTLTTVWPATQAGGGFSLLVESQRLQHRASVGCLVSDGHALFALTNRHVCGRAGERISAQMRGGPMEIGTSSQLQLTRQPFQEVYPGLAGTDTYLNLDAGLVELDDARQWTASFYGLGAVGEVADLNEGNLSLSLIDREVRAHGAASGQLDGTIKALFYRYKSVAGVDYVADMLIAPKVPGTSTQPGDSGTVWHLVVKGDGRSETLHPLALEWGAQPFRGAGAGNFTLATNLSSVCRLLDVEVVLEHNTAARPFWGATGHYSIATTALEGVKEPKLGPFLRTNAEFISFDRATLASGTIEQTLKHAKPVPLADVPDVIWKKLPSKMAPGGRDTAPNVGPEHPTHYCDIDQPDKQGKTLHSLCIADPKRVDVAFWQQFYTEQGRTESAERGCLPFRVWQFYDAMVASASAGDYVGYLCAAGLVSHYVGDACQPLHGSYLSNGDPNRSKSVTTKGGHTKQVKYGEGVHSAYETHMIDRHAAELFEAIDKLLAKRPPSTAPIASGHDAAVAIVQLMDRTAKTLQPMALIERYVELGGGTSRHTLDGLWESFAKQTATIMTDGIRVLRHVWIAAWRAGASKQAKDLGAIAPAEIIKHYTNAKFVPSLDLDSIGSVLK